MAVGTLSSAGLGSGLDISGLVTKLMAVEKQPITAIEAKQASFQAKISAFGTLKSALSALQTASTALSTPAKMTPMTATVADPTILSANVGSTATAGTYNIEVQQLAQSQKLLSAGYANTGDPVGTFGKTITFTFGTYTGSGPATFTANAAKPATSITLSSTNNSLANLRDAINAANLGVRATIINDGSATNPYHLSFSSIATGAASAMKVTVDDASLNALTYDPTAGGTSNMTQTDAALDSIIKLDTLTVTKPTNTITDAITGVTLNLTKESASGVTTKLTLAENSSGVKTAVQAMIDAYNGVRSAMVSLTAYDPTNQKGSILTGDGTARLIDTQLRSLLSKPVPGLADGASMLSDYGITFQKDGTLAMDSGKFSAAMTDSTKDIVALFASKGMDRGYALQLSVLTGQMTSPVGLLGNHNKSLNSSIETLEKQKLAINNRLVIVEANYRRQFSRLDTLVASMQTTTQFLTQQLASINNNNK